MTQYRLNLTEEEVEETRRQTLQELYDFVELMNERPLAVVTLSTEQSRCWDEEGDVDYQDEYGRQIIRQVSDGVTETLLIRNSEGLPVALAACEAEGSWMGIGVDKRLRFEIAAMFQGDETDFE